jgi:hypothetical protein
MVRMNAGLLAVLGSVFFAPGLAQAQTSTLQQRCVADTLDPAQSEARLRWARKCALLKTQPGAWFDTGVPTSTGSTGFTLYDYPEPGGDGNWTGINMYTGQTDNYEINYSFISKLYNSGATYQSVDANGFYEWSRASTRKKLRPLYPVYGTDYDLSSGLNRQLFPHPTLANCGLYLDRYGAQPASGWNFYLNGYCEAAAPLGSTALTSGVPVGPLSGVANGSQYFNLMVPAGARSVVFETSGGTGDVDLYVRFSATPDGNTYDCRPLRSGNTESCVMNYPSSGYWYVMLLGYTNYSGVTLKGTVNY